MNKKRKPLTIEQHLKRYHRDYYSQCMEFGREQARGIFERNPEVQSVHFPVLLPACETFAARFPLGAYTDFEVIRKELEPAGSK
jgi:hypothetical protein